MVSKTAARQLSTVSGNTAKSANNKLLITGAALAGITASGLLYAESLTANAMTAAEHGLHSPEFDWPQNGPFSTFDHASIRRGYQVYREVCAACHSLDRVAWRTLVGVSHTNSEVKEMAEEFEYDDEPDDNGNPKKRPCLAFTINDKSGGRAPWLAALAACSFG